MAQSRRKRRSEPVSHLGKQPPRHRFILNPYADIRLTTCPRCNGRTLLRKIALAVHIEPLHLMTLNKHCRYCKVCDLVIAHQDEVEAMLAAAYSVRAPEVLGNDYLVLGTLDRADWRRLSQKDASPADLLECLHDFEEVLVLEYTPGGWYRE
jgi:hypothetical protein